VIGLGEALREPPPRNEIAGAIIALVALVGMTITIVLLPPGPRRTVRPAAVLFPILLWLAARYRPVFAAAAAFVVSLTVVWAITSDIGHFGDPAVPIGDRILDPQAGILVFALCACSCGIVRRAAPSRGTPELLIAELDHRVKNVLARVAAVATHTRQRGKTRDEFVEALHGRI